MIQAIYLFLSLLPFTTTARSLPYFSNTTIANPNLDTPKPSITLSVPIPSATTSISIPSPSPSLSTASIPKVGPSILCGSRGMPKCASGLTCIPNPSNLATSLLGDAPGLCAKLDGQSCGGTSGQGCPAAQVCVDKPNDSCKPMVSDEGLPLTDPSEWRTDCPGICVFLDGRSALA
ncbi:hypothetical protein G7Y79_00049g084490 [Physcia stellaris]|nr:hypothetical protein G7Y79_00049g084490 [Physcia stellaris]